MQLCLWLSWPWKGQWALYPNFKSRKTCLSGCTFLTSCLCMTKPRLLASQAGLQAVYEANKHEVTPTENTSMYAYIFSTRGNGKTSHSETFQTFECLPQNLVPFFFRDTWRGAEGERRREEMAKCRAQGQSRSRGWGKRRRGVECTPMEPFMYDQWNYFCSI